MAGLPRLAVITDWAVPDLLERVRAVCALGSEVAVMHRAPGLPVRPYLERARALQAICAPAGTPLFVGARLDVALACGAHLHLPEDAPSPGECRPWLPAGRWISVAFHDGTPLERVEGADVALVSPVFSPGSKPGDTRPTLGVHGFHRLAGTLPCPAWALGGMDPGHARALGPAAGVAVISACWRAENPLTACGTLLEVLKAAPAR
ncbi:MAG: putative thiamine-phosphate pyrophosphorylase [Pseudomonadota bacterium]|jgi:thiamine-phosphate pyrophosphorylase